MLLVVGWSSVVLWLNVRPRVKYLPNPVGEYGVYDASFGRPWTYAFDLDFSPSSPPRFSLAGALTHDTWAWPLAANITIGLLAVTVLTFASKYLLRAIAALLRACMSKPPPADVDGD